MKRDLLEQIADKFTVGDGCWEWTAAKTPAGYGCFRRDKRTRYAHRTVYELIVGPIPEGLVLDHLCKVRHCVNPAHLEPVTNAENIRRGGHAAKTHCVNGHPLSGENLMPREKPGWRRCRTCHINANARR